MSFKEWSKERAEHFEFCAMSALPPENRLP